MITEQKFLRYVALQFMGYTNMFEIHTVEKVTGINKEDILEIMKNYQNYWSKYFGDNTRSDRFIYERIIKNIRLKPKTKKKSKKI